MGKKYKHLTLEERIEIYRLRADGKSLGAISELIGRDKSTVSRELKRNSQPTKSWAGGYEPVRAHELA